MNHLTSRVLFAGTVCLALALQASAMEEGFQSIFNGKDLSGWDGNTKLWSVKDGVIVGKTSAEDPLKANTFLIWTNGTTSDFELRFSYKITANNDKGFANSGVQYRSKVLDPAGWRVGGYQADFEAGPAYSGILYDEGGVAGGRGIMAARGEKIVWDKDGKKQVAGSVGKSEDIQAAIKKGDWNDYVIVAQGGHLQHFINGLPTVDVTDDCEAKALKSGVLALQVHAGPPMQVEFKDLRLKAGGGDDLAKMNGLWEIVATEANGEQVPKEDFAGITVKIDGGKYTINKHGDTDTGALTVDASKTPKQMDIRPETGEGAGETIPAIYEWTGNGMRVCYTTEPGSGRPQKFSPTDYGRVLVTYKRKQ